MQIELSPTSDSNMGEYASGYHKKLFETNDLRIQKQLWEAAKLHDQAHQDGDDVGAGKQLEDALKLRGLEVTEGEGRGSSFFRSEEPKLEVIDGGLGKVVPLIRPTST